MYTEQLVSINVLGSNLRQCGLCCCTVCIAIQ